MCYLFFEINLLFHFVNFISITLLTQLSASITPSVFHSKLNTHLFTNPFYRRLLIPSSQPSWTTTSDPISSTNRFIDHFSGPGIAIGTVCVRLDNDFW